jgi:hypothetical protein
MIFRLLLFLLFFPLKNEYTPVLSTYDRLVIFVFHVCFVEFVDRAEANTLTIKEVKEDMSQGTDHLIILCYFLSFG